MIRRSLFVFIVLAAVLLALPILTHAQDATLEPTAEVTPTPEPGEPPVQLPDDVLRVTLPELLLYIGLSILAGGGVWAIIERFLQRKEVRDSIEKAYDSLPVETQERLFELIEAGEQRTEYLFEWLRGVTDKQPNQ